MRRLVHALPAVALAVSVGVTVAAPAEAATRGRCRGGSTGPTCYFWTGKVTFVADGDTVHVDIYGDGTSTPKAVRMTGLQAMEQTVYSRTPSRRRGECHALAATARLEQLIKAGGGVVRLAAQDPRSKSGTRLRRSVAVKLNGVWTDVGNILTKEGHVLWLPNSVENAWNRTLNYNTQVAASRRLRIWDKDSCGLGPDQATPLTMWVNWDADGTDGVDLNGEWARIKNSGAVDMSLAGWWFRDSHLRRYTLPAGATLPAGGTVTVYIGSGANTATTFYWGQAGSVFDNVTHDARNLGDGGYLFDPQGDLRAWSVYPCRYQCADPLTGKVAVSAHPTTSEYVDIRNLTTSAIALEGYLVETHPYIYAFGPGHWLDAGETLRLYVGGGVDSRLVSYWGKQSSILNNDGDTVRIKNFRDGVIACHTWGTGRC